MVDRTVPPTDVARILLSRVLCVVEQQIDTAVTQAVKDSLAARVRDLL